MCPEAVCVSAYRMTGDVCVWSCVSLQCVSAAAPCHRGAHHPPALRPHEGEVPRVRQGADTAELEVLDCILCCSITEMILAGFPKNVRGSECVCVCVCVFLAAGISQNVL